jgi:hypothetical protein
LSEGSIVYCATVDHKNSMGVYGNRDNQDRSAWSGRCCKNTPSPSSDSCARLLIVGIEGNCTETETVRVALSGHHQLMPLIYQFFHAVCESHTVSVRTLLPTTGGKGETEKGKPWYTEQEDTHHESCYTDATIADRL